ncbi:900_t:CDS:2, partial [Racocetra fulgida]
MAVLRRRPTRNSLSTLRNISAEIILKAQIYHPVYLVIYIDVEKNNIVVVRSLDDDETNQTFLDAIQPYHPIMHYYEEPKRRPPGSPNSTHTKPPEHNTFLYAPWETVPSLGRKIGPMVIYNESVDDFGLIRITNEELKPTRNIRNTEDEEFKELFIRDVEP